MSVYLSPLSFSLSLTLSLPHSRYLSSLTSPWPWHPTLVIDLPWPHDLWTTLAMKRSRLITLGRLSAINMLSNYKIQTEVKLLCSTYADPRWPPHIIQMKVHKMGWQSELSDWDTSQSRYDMQSDMHVVNPKKRTTGKRWTTTLTFNWVGCFVVLTALVTRCPCATSFCLMCVLWEWIIIRKWNFVGALECRPNDKWQRGNGQ